MLCWFRSDHCSEPRCRKATKQVRQPEHLDAMMTCSFSMDAGVRIHEEAVSWDAPIEVECECYDNIPGALLDPPVGKNTESERD